MHVYFIRHGETVLNHSGRHQAASTPLSSNGVEQARSVAEYLRAMNPDIIISSSHTRALETSRIIGNTLAIRPVVSTVFREIDRPTSLAGRPLLCMRSICYVLYTALFRNNPSRRFEDAENFSDIYTRIKESVQYIESLSEKYDSVVIVSHKIFINLLVVYMCYARMYLLRDVIPSLLNVRQLQNGGVVTLKRRTVRSIYGSMWNRVV